MKKYGLQLLAAMAITVVFFAILGWAGDIDYCDQIILRMSQEEYDSVKNHLWKLNGEKPSERDIAHWWAEHHYRMD